MINKLIILILIFTSNFTIAQVIPENKIYYVDALIYRNQDIYVGENKVDLNEVPTVVRESINGIPFHVNNKIVFRIFGDENLKLGNIIDLEQKMVEGFSEPDGGPIRYLLSSGDMPLDGSHWLKDIRSLERNALKKN